MKISKPLFELQTENFEFDAVVVGSGYGASVLSARLARYFPKGKMAVLERGKEWRPSDFPTRLPETLQEFKSGAHPYGLFDFQPGLDFDVLRGSGLGGTSLLNAAVMLDPEALHRLDPNWPEELTPDAMAECSNRARDILRPRVYPDRAETSERATALDGLGRPQRFRPALPKAELLKNAARAYGFEAHWKKAELAIRFEDEAETRTDFAGRTRGLCIYCGNCVTGCVVGAKNTLDQNYLPLAASEGAQLFTCVEVNSIEPLRLERGSYRYRIHAVTLKPGRHGYQKIEVKILARSVFLGAGALGSTEILLRSVRKHDLRLSRTLGTLFSGNADSFSIATINREPSPLESPNESAPGPTISSMIDLRASHGFILQDGSVPNALQGPLEKGIGKFDRERSLVWLGMGYDSSHGRLELDARDKVKIIWPDSGDSASMQSQKEIFTDLSRLIGAKHNEHPRAAPITVHPLGGCPMGSTISEGTVDSAGRLFHRDGGTYPGFYVMDGSVCRGSVGSNPALTIASLAEFAARRIIREDLERIQ